MPIPYAVVDAALQERGWSWRALRAGDTPATPRDLVMRLWHDDRPLWAECTLVERKRGGLWRLYDYQAEALRDDGHAVWECAAEVGKTRDIIARFLHRAKFRRGDQLIAGATDGSLEDIWTEMTWQLSGAPTLRALWDQENTKVKPYRVLVFKNGNRIYMRPASHDGRAFRGVHVSSGAAMEEAALIESDRVWGEFWRAIEDGCPIGLYSVPTGMASRYQELADGAPLYDPEVPRNPRTWVKFRWSRTAMPTWSEARRLEMVTLYGGETTALYRRNILGEQGEPENVVFPREIFERCVGYLAEYRYILVRQVSGRIVVRAYRLNEHWSLYLGADAESAALAAGQLEEVGEASSRPVEDLDPDAFDPARAYAAALELIRPYIVPGTGRGQMVMGADLGKSVGEPTEVSASRIGERWEWIHRARLEGVRDWRVQAMLFAAIDELLGYPSYGAGIDATGSGSGLESALLSLSIPGRHSYRTRLSGYPMGELVPETDEEGQPLRSHRDRVINRKERATRYLERHLQGKVAHVPWDTYYMEEIPRHTSVPVAGGRYRKFSDNKDHGIDAKRCEILRWFDVEYSSEPSGPLTHGVVSGERHGARPRGREMGRAFGGRGR